MVTYIIIGQARWEGSRSEEAEEKQWRGTHYLFSLCSLPFIWLLIVQILYDSSSDTDEERQGVSKKQVSDDYKPTMLFCIVY